MVSTPKCTLYREPITIVIFLIGKIFDVNRYINQPVLDRLVAKQERYIKALCKSSETRFARVVRTKRTDNIAGDETLVKLNDLFFNGLDARFSPIQQTIFRSCVDCALPKIYGDEWNTVKERVLHQRGLDKTKQELLIQMGRRNGKTFSVSAVAATFLLTIPNVKIAIFSVSERQSKMLMSEIEARIQAAFKKGTHVTKDQFTVKQKNKERLVFIMNETGTEQEVGSYPGSVRVTFYFC